jgi:hypothetical protein
MARCTVWFLPNEHGDKEALSYIKDLAQRFIGRFQATALFLEVGSLETYGPADDHARFVIDDTVTVYLLRYEVHVLAYAPHPEDETKLYVLTAFHERHYAKGKQRAEELARLFFGIGKKRH